MLCLIGVACGAAYAWVYRTAWYYEGMGAVLRWLYICVAWQLVAFCEMILFAKAVRGGKRRLRLAAAGLAAYAVFAVGMVAAGQEMLLLLPWARGMTYAWCALMGLFAGMEAGA